MRRGRLLEGGDASLLTLTLTKGGGLTTALCCCLPAGGAARLLVCTVDSCTTVSLQYMPVWLERIITVLPASIGLLGLSGLVRLKRSAADVPSPPSFEYTGV